MSKTLTDSDITRALTYLRLLDEDLEIFLENPDSVDRHNVTASQESIAKVRTVLRGGRKCT